jgi:hypothetical protein
LSAPDQQQVIADIARRAISAIGTGGHSHWRQGGYGGRCNACTEQAEARERLTDELTAALAASNAGTDPADGQAVPESAHRWAAEHGIVSTSEADGWQMRRRPATWRDAPTTWGEAFDWFAARRGEDAERALGQSCGSLTCDGNAHIPGGTP